MNPGATPSPSGGGGARRRHALADRLDGMACAARQLDCYQRQLEDLQQKQQAYEAANARKQYLDSLPIPEASHPANKASMEKLSDNIQELTQAEADAEAARVVFQENLEKHTQRAADAESFLADARQRRATLTQEQSATQQERGEIQQGQQGLQRGEQEQGRVEGEGNRGRNEGQSTQNTVNSTNPGPGPEPPEEDVPWYRVDKHVVNAAKAAWRATVGRAMRAIAEKWNALKQRLMQMLMEFALGLAGGDELKQKLRNAGQKAQQNQNDNQQAGATQEQTSGHINQQEQTGNQALTDAQQTMQGYAELVVEAEETKRLATERKQQATEWRDQMRDYMAQFEQAYGTSFTEAGRAQNETWGQQDRSAGIQAVEAAMEALQAKYQGDEEQCNADAQAIQEEDQREAEAENMGGDEGAPDEEMDGGGDEGFGAEGFEGAEEEGEPFEEEPMMGGDEGFEEAPDEEMDGGIPEGGIPSREAQEDMELESEEHEGGIPEDGIPAIQEDEEPEEPEQESAEEPAAGGEPESGGPSPEDMSAEPPTADVAPSNDQPTSNEEQRAAAALLQGLQGLQGLLGVNRNELLQHLDSWNALLGQESPGLNLAATLQHAALAFDQSAERLRQELARIQGALSGASLDRIAELRESLRQLAESVEALPRDLMEQLRGIYLRTLEDGQGEAESEETPTQPTAPQ